MSAKPLFNDRAKRLQEDPRIVRVQSLDDFDYFPHRKEFDFNAIVFDRPLTQKERKDAEYYIQNAQLNMIDKNTGNRYRTYEIKGHFDKVRRRTIPERVKTLPVAPFMSDCIASYLRMEEDLDERLSEILVDLTLDSYDWFLPKNEAYIQAIENTEGKVSLDNIDLYERYSSFLRVRSAQNSNPHIHSPTLIYAMLKEGPIFYDKKERPTYQLKEGEIALHDETMSHGAPSNPSLDRLTYITGLGW